MGNSASSTARGDGLPFVTWKPSVPSAENGSAISSAAPTGDGALTWHFAEPSSYRYDTCPRFVTAPIVWADPPKMDGELRNRNEMLGNIVLIERGGRLHFPDIIRRIVSAGAVGCIFLERATGVTTHSLFDGFHSSGRQKVTIPIVLLSLFHADQLLRDLPTRVSIERLSGDKAIARLVADDLVVAVATAARAGEVDVLKHILYSDDTGSIRERIPKAVALCDAAERGHVDCLEILHGFGISLDEQKPNGTSALMMACSVGNVEAARALLMFGTNVDLEDVHGLTALMIAARDGRVQCLKLLIRKGALVNLSRNRNRGTTALHIAARGGQDECVSVLLGAGAALEIESPNSTTALMEAARAGNLNCVKLLANAGSSIETKDREGHTAEMLAKLSGHTIIEDFLRERAESESVKDHRRKIQEAVANPDSTLEGLMALARESNISVDILKREITQGDGKYAIWLEQPRIIFEVFRLLTEPVDPRAAWASTAAAAAVDPVYGYYTVQYFCCELAMYYPRRIFQRGPPGVSPIVEELDVSKSAGYLKVLFRFLCTSGQLDDVLLILFCKVVNHYIVDMQLGHLLLAFFAGDGKFLVPRLVSHIGLDSIRDLLVWLLYSDMSDEAQRDVRRCGIFECLYSRLFSWQRTLSWGVGTSYQRDSIENICAVFNYIVYPPSVYMMGNMPTFVDNTDHSLPLITDQYFPSRHNELLKSLLLFSRTSELSFGNLIDLGFAEIFRQSSRNCDLVVEEGGALSVVMMVMSTLGYHKRKRDLTAVEKLLVEVKADLLGSLASRVPQFVKLCHAVITGNEAEMRQLVDIPTTQPIVVHCKGSSLLYIVTFLKRCVFLQETEINETLAHFGLMPCLLLCYGAHPTNNLLHHELTDVIRFVLLDPDQQRSPSCPLLNSLFSEPANILDFVTRAYDSHVQYKGHLTTIANSIFTLTSTPLYKREKHAITCQEIVREYTSKHENWTKFEAVLAEQNLLEMEPLGQRHAPLCDGCLRLKESAVEYVSDTLTTEVQFTGYLETIFSGAASHYCKLNSTDDFITGFLYKKDKIHDHIPIPEPTRVSSFIQFPVPMPFHALTFTVTYFGLCRKCDKLWYCDTLQSANWTNRMKWVIPTSVRKWYSFGVTEGPGSGAHGIQFSTKGYKNFLVLCDTWGRQEQWVQAFEGAILGLSSHVERRMNAASAMSFEIDNEVDTDEFDLSRMNPISSPDSKESSTVVTPSSSHATSTSRMRRRRSKTVSGALNELGKSQAHDDSSSEDDGDCDEGDTDGLNPNGRLSSSRPKSATSTRMNHKAMPVKNPSRRLATENALKTGKPLPSSPPKLRSAQRSAPIKSGGSLSKLDLQRFQEDTKRYTEILNNLNRTSTSSRPGNAQQHATRSPVLSSPVMLRTARDVDALALTRDRAASRNNDGISPSGGAAGIRHAISMQDLTAMNDRE